MASSTIFVFYLALIITVCVASDLDLLTVPEGFILSRYIDENAIAEPRSLAMTYFQNATIIYVGTMTANIYALIDYDSDSTNDKIYHIWTAQSSSDRVRNVALDHNHNELYISVQASSTWRCRNIHSKILSFTDDQHTLNETDCQLWFEGISYTGHADHYMVYDHVNDQLCMAFGADGNIVGRNYPETNILCFDDMEHPDCINVTVQAQGVRHSVGMEFHPLTHDLWFTDNNRDRFGDNKPDGKLNRVSVIGEDFGYPYCHSGGYGDPYLRDVATACHLVDDIFGDEVGGDCDAYTVTEQPLGPHVAPLGMKFYYNRYNESGYMFPDKYYMAIFVAEHGSWNRETKIGARVMVIFLGCDESKEDYSRVIGHEWFLSGMIQGDSYIGRPADVEVLIDGSIIISDDESNNIYRVSYNTSFMDGTTQAAEQCDFNELNEVAQIIPYCNATDEPTTFSQNGDQRFHEVSFQAFLLCVIHLMSCP